jgi:hypothetical protein
MREKCRLFENRVLWRIFGPKGNEVTGEWRKLHNEELHVLNPSPTIVRDSQSSTSCLTRTLHCMITSEQNLPLYDNI